MPSKIASGHKSIKHDIIDKNNNTVLIAVAGATFVFIFCAFAARALISQSLYHGRVIGEKEKTLDQVRSNLAAVEELKQSFDAFQSEPINILGGNPSGDGPLDGNNAKLVLDALPSKYDFPALSSSFEKILKTGGYDIGSIGGAEDISLATSVDAAGVVQPVQIPYSFTVNADRPSTQTLLETLEKSIRPMFVERLLIQSGETILETRVTLHTYFAQSKTFELGSKEVK